MASNLSFELRKRVYKKYNGRCAYCGCKIKYTEMHVDHIKPIHRGISQAQLDKMNITKGDNILSNLNPSCAPCNISKSTFTLEDWRSEISLKANRERSRSSTFRLLERFKIIRVRDFDISFYFENHK